MGLTSLSNSYGDSDQLGYFTGRQRDLGGLMQSFDCYVTFGVKTALETEEKGGTDSILNFLSAGVSSPYLLCRQQVESPA